MKWLVEWWGLPARILVGGVWIAAAVIKLPDPAGSVRAVRAYDLLPESVVPLAGHTLPILELVVGVCLVLGLLTRPASVVSAVLFTTFIIGIASAWARGLQIECGCFGGGGFDADATSKYPWELARDVGLLVLSLLLAWRPRTPFAVDAFLFPTETQPAEGVRQPR